MNLKLEIGFCFIGENPMGLKEMAWNSKEQLLFNDNFYLFKMIKFTISNKL